MSEAVLPWPGPFAKFAGSVTLETCADFGWRTYIPEPRRQHPIKLSSRSEAQRRAVLNNRSRTSRSKSKRLQRRRSEVVERTFAHVCETGGSRRSHLRGLVNATKRYLLAVAAHSADETYTLKTIIPVPGGLTSFDIAFVDANIRTLVLADRTNKSIDVVDTSTNILTHQYHASPRSSVSWPALPMRPARTA